MISHLDLLMPVFKYLPKDKYPSNPGLKSSTYGPLMPRVGYSDRFETCSGLYADIPVHVLQVPAGEEGGPGGLPNLLK